MTPPAVNAVDAPPVADHAIIRLDHVSRVYQVGESEVRALDDVSLAIPRGEFAAIMGPSGSGKSTMLNVLGCLDTPTSGTYTLDGESVEKLSEDQLAQVRQRKIGFIFQSFNLIGDLTVFENVELPLIYRGMKAAERRERANAALESVGLSKRVTHRPDQLSGGERQRVAIARALVMEPSILLADEPTGNLDSKSGESVMELLHELYMSGATICMVTHDPRYARHADRSIHLFDGRVVGEPMELAATE